MTESILRWMQNYEARFQEPGSLKTSQFNLLQDEKFEDLEDPQKSLDSFLKESNDSSLFDDHFNRADFQQVMNAWKEKNLPEVAVN